MNYEQSIGNQSVMEVRSGSYRTAGIRGAAPVVPVVAESAFAESVSAGKTSELSTPLPVTESVTVCSLEADPHAVIRAEIASISAVFFILVFVFLND
jgi:hypothetical protein